MSRGLRQKLELFDPTLPLERARTIPSCWYTDPDIAKAEARNVFGDTWQALGRLDQVAGPGAFFTADLVGEPILVLRDEEEVLRAFANVCRHRAARVVREACGTATRLRCPYHGWTYDLAGRLRGAPEFGGVADFDRDEQGLPALTAAAWGPVVWVHAGAAPPPLLDFLSPLPERHAAPDLLHLRWAGRRNYQPRCNWKVFIDNFLDGGYHINSLHPGLAGIVDYTQYQTQIIGNTSVQVGPLRPTAAGEGGAVGRVRTGEAAHYWWVFPNFFASVYADVFITSLVLPAGVDCCRVRCDFYFAAGEGPEADQRHAESIAVSEKIQQEDITICEEVQCGLASRSFHAGRYSVARETAVYHFHRLLARRLTDALAGPSARQSSGGELMDLTIAPLLPGAKATDEAVALLWGGLGTDYIEAPELQAYQQGQGSRIALGAFATDEVVGVLLARLLTREEAANFEALARQSGSPIVLALSTVGILQSFVVKHTHRGQGIGTELCREAIRHLRQSGATCLLALSWESGTGDTSRGLLERLGLKVVARLEEFWRDDSLARGYHCPRCGNPCQCAALLHVC